MRGVVVLDLVWLRAKLCQSMDYAASCLVLRYALALLIRNQTAIRVTAPCVFAGACFVLRALCGDLLDVLRNRQKIAGRRMSALSAAVLINFIIFERMHVHCTVVYELPIVPYRF